MSKHSTATFTRKKKKSNYIIRFNIYAIKDAFFEFICNITTGFEQFIHNENRNNYKINGAPIFNKDAFISKAPKEQKLFYTNFINTQLFEIFVETIVENNSEEINYFKKMQNIKRTKLYPYVFREFQCANLYINELPDSEGISNESILLSRDVFLQYISYIAIQLILCTKGCRKL
jgi:dDENN domain